MRLNSIRNGFLVRRSSPRWYEFTITVKGTFRFANQSLVEIDNCIRWSLRPAHRSTQYRVWPPDKSFILIVCEWLTWLPWIHHDFFFLTHLTVILDMVGASILSLTFLLGENCEGIRNFCKEKGKTSFNANKFEKVEKNGKTWANISARQNNIIFIREMLNCKQKRMLVY